MSRLHPRSLLPRFLSLRVLHFLGLTSVALVLPAQAVPYLLIWQGAATPVVTTVADNGPLDTDPAVGSISYTGAISLHTGTFSGISRPFTVVDPLGLPFMEVSGTFSSGPTGTQFASILSVALVDSQFGPVDSALHQLMVVTGPNAGGILTLVPPSPFFTTPSLVTGFGSHRYGTVDLNPPYSLTLGASATVPKEGRSTPVTFTTTASVISRVPDTGSSLVLFLVAIGMIGAASLKRRQQEPSSQPACT